MLWLQGVKLLHSYRVLSPTLINRHFVTLNESQYNALAEKSLECLVDSLEACQNRATNTKEDIEVSLSVRMSIFIIHIIYRIVVLLIYLYYLPYNFLFFKILSKYSLCSKVF